MRFTQSHQWPLGGLILGVALVFVGVLSVVFGSSAPFELETTVILVGISLGILAFPLVLYRLEYPTALVVDDAGVHTKRGTIRPHQIGEVTVVGRWQAVGAREVDDVGGYRVPSRQNLHGGIAALRPGVLVVQESPAGASGWLFASPAIDELAAAVRALRDDARRSADS